MQNPTSVQPADFKVGDRVIHASHGSGQIVAIEEKRLSGREPKLYYEVALDKSTVWVPVDADSVTRLRLLATKSDLPRCRTLLKGRPTHLSADRQERYRNRLDRLREGSFESMCEILRDLTAFGWPKPLSEMDAAALRKIKEAVCHEWSVAAGLPLSEANQEITALLQEGFKAHHH